MAKRERARRERRGGGGIEEIIYRSGKAGAGACKFCKERLKGKMGELQDLWSQASRLLATCRCTTISEAPARTHQIPMPPLMSHTGHRGVTLRARCYATLTRRSYAPREANASPFTGKTSGYPTVDCLRRRGSLARTVARPSLVRPESCVPPTPPLAFLLADPSDLLSLAGRFLFAALDPLLGFHGNVIPF